MIGSEILDILRTVGTWLAGISGTLTGITSLYLARRDLHVRLRLSVDHRVLVTPGLKETPGYCSIRIVNVGFRPAIITGIGWKMGFIRRKYGIQTVQDHPMSGKLPIKLDSGGDVSYLIGFLDEGSYPYWIDEIKRSFLPYTPKISPLTIKVQVYTSIGRTYESRIKRGLRQRLAEFAKKQKANH